MRLLSILPPGLENSAGKRNCSQSSIVTNKALTNQVLKFSGPTRSALEWILFGLGSHLLLEIRIRSGRAQFVYNIQREQCCNDQCQQNADNRAKRLTPLRRIAYPKPATPTAFVTAIGLVRGQCFDELLAEPTRMRSVSNAPAVGTKHPGQESSFRGQENAPAFYSRGGAN